MEDKWANHRSISCWHAPLKKTSFSKCWSVKPALWKLLRKLPLEVTLYEVKFQRWSRGHKARGQGQGQGHKKIRGQGQGQGQPFRGQTLSRPRTGMLEAKAKDQGHKRKCSPKKKKKRSSKKFFRRYTKF